MRITRHLSITGPATLLACLTTLATGCSGDLNADGQPSTMGAGAAATTATGTTAPTGTSTTGVNTATTGVGGTGGVYTDPSTCIPGIPETTQVARIKNAQYDNIVFDLLGVATLANGQKPSSLLNTDSTGPMNRFMFDAYINAATTIAAEVMAGPNRANFIACDPAAEGCLDQTVATFGRKLFRRPLTDGDMARFAALRTTTPAGTPEEVAETTLMAFLLSPSFLQINEMGPDPDTGAEMEGAFYKLTSHEVAARLSLMLWGTTPDTDLMAAADQNLLQSTDQILAQAQRLLADRAKAGPQIAAIHQAYLAIDDDAGHWFKVRPDTTRYPLYKPEADVAMKAELDAFFTEVAYMGGTFGDIFLSNIGFVNADTAPLYGVDATGLTTELTKVDLDPNTRPGFLTRLGFLSSHTHATETSPILRGAFIAKNVIGTDRELIPDPDALKTPPPEGTFLTEREYVQELTNKPACSGCHHVYVNPPGFVLEVFDAAGAIQTTDPRGGAINGTADVLFGDQVVTITSPLQMMQLIAQGEFTRRSYTEKVVSATLNRLPNSNDACTVDNLNAALATPGYTILNLFADITQADSFRLRNRAAN